MNLTTSTTILKAATLAIALVISIPGAFASNYHLRGAICGNDGNPSITLVTNGKFGIRLTTGGKNKVGLAVKGLEQNPITVKDLDVKSPITTVFGSVDKEILKGQALWCKILLKNDDGKLIVPTSRVSPSQFDINRGAVPLVKNGDTYSATYPSSLIISLGKEVPRLKLSENSKVVGFVIYLDGNDLGFRDPNVSAVVNSVSVAGEQLPLKLENPLGCDAFPTVVIVQ